MYRLPAEWEPQWGVMLTWPHADTDWAPILNDIERVYLDMAEAIVRHENLLVVAQNDVEVGEKLARLCSEKGLDRSRITVVHCETNDTWARDHGPITLVKAPLNPPLRGEKEAVLLDFRFNGWGEKFEAEKDNAITRAVFCEKLREISTDFGNSRQMSTNVDNIDITPKNEETAAYESHLDFVLEGGAIESDGHGTVFTTTGCLMAPNRNQPLTQSEIEEELKRRLRADRIVWIDHGNLDGDDTDGHIDTLVRVAPNDTLLYVKADYHYFNEINNADNVAFVENIDIIEGAEAPETSNESDEHKSLKAMEEQLKTLRNQTGEPYKLIPLPSPTPIFHDGEKLPATYANFLIINGAVLVPTYDQPENDSEAARQIAKAFPDRKIIAIDCRPVIVQHGSLHCCTMQLPAAIIQD